MIKNTIRSFVRKKYYRILAYSIAIVLTTGIIGFRLIEKWSWLDSVNYSVSTMVTTGNAGVIPKSDIGKVFNIFYMTASVVLILLFINSIQQHFRDIEQNKKMQKKRRKKIAKEKVEQAITTETEPKSGSSAVSP